METLTLTELCGRMARRWRTLITGAAIVLVLGLSANLALPSRYEALAIVRVDPTDTAQVDMTAEESTARSRRVATEALDILGDATITIDDLEGAVTVNAVRDSNVLRISYAARAPIAAVKGADAVANAYLALRTVDAAEKLERLGNRLRHELRSPDTRDVLGTELARITALGTPGGRIIDPARRPTSPAGPDLAACGLAGLVLGLLASAPFAARPKDILVSRRPEAPAS